MLKKNKFYIERVQGPVQYVPGEYQEMHRLQMKHPDAGVAPEDDLYFSPTYRTMDYDPATGVLFNEPTRTLVPGADPLVVAFVDTIVTDGGATRIEVMLRTRSDLQGNGYASLLVEEGLKNWLPDDAEALEWTLASPATEAIFDKAGKWAKAKQVARGVDGKIAKEHRGNSGK